MAQQKPIIAWVEGRRLQDAFLDFPRRRYANDPHWVVPVRLAERWRWSPRHNPGLIGRQAVRFVALRNGEVVRRIAGLADPAFARRRHDGAGFFGFFESFGDQGVTDALLQAAEDWLRWNKLTSVIGPVNLTTHDEVGILVESFGELHTIICPYNPTYYANLRILAA